MAIESNARRLTDQELAELGPPEAVRLPLDLVDPSPRNPRQGELPEVDALADNIRAFGLLQPVTVRRLGERYELVGGHRRRAAFLRLREQYPHEPDWRTIPAVVRDADDDRGFLMLLSSQLHSRNWKPREEAAALERLVQAGLTVTQVGETLHRTQEWASKRLRVYADAVLSGYVQSGRLPPSVAEELIVIKDAPTRKNYAEQAVEGSWTQAHARNEVNRLKTSKALREVARQARYLLDLLSSVTPAQIPDAAARDLLRLSRRIDQLAKTGGRPVLPTIEQAQRAAGIKEVTRSRQLRSGLGPARKRTR